MREPRAKMIAGPVQENLRLIFQAAKGPRMNDPRAVALKLRAVIVTRIGIFSPARVAGFLREGCEKAALVRFHFLPRLPALTRNGGASRIFCHNGIIGRCTSFASPEFRHPEESAMLNFPHCGQPYGNRMSRRSKKTLSPTKAMAGDASAFWHDRWTV